MAARWRYVKSALVGASLWGIGDFLGQSYNIHKHRSKRRMQNKMLTERSQILLETDNEPNKQYVVESSLFGLLVGFAAHHYQRLLIRTCGTLYQRSILCFFLLGIQQMVWTPLLLLSYFNSMTAARGFFSNPSLMTAHTAGAQGRHNVWSIQKHIIENVMPTPLLTSWFVFCPLFWFAYIGRRRCATVLRVAIALPWCSSVALAQHRELV
ncbi:unnamed protein product [Phytomonas sp. Hart1]|nr:unnamed protein product [Phytomonas sp. Hart1]|eukprot:CCW71159.1 unnamed protein product [Phytomonas sp. isolate Hart1]